MPDQERTTWTAAFDVDKNRTGGQHAGATRRRSPGHAGYKDGSADTPVLDTVGKIALGDIRLPEAGSDSGLLRSVSELRS